MSGEDEVGRVGQVLDFIERAERIVHVDVDARRYHGFEAAVEIGRVHGQHRPAPARAEADNLVARRVAAHPMNVHAVRNLRLPVHEFHTAGLMEAFGFGQIAQKMVDEVVFRRVAPPEIEFAPLEIKARTREESRRHEMIPVKMAHDQRLDIRGFDSEMPQQLPLLAVVGVIGVSRLLGFLAEAGVDDDGSAAILRRENPEEIGERARPPRFAQVKEPGGVARARALAQGV